MYVINIFLEICKRNESTSCTDYNVADIVLPFDVLNGIWNKICPSIISSQLNAELQKRIITDILNYFEKLVAKQFQSSLAVSYSNFIIQLPYLVVYV